MPNTLFFFQGLPSWHPKSIPKTCFLKTFFWTPFLVILYWFYMKMTDLGPVQNPVGAQMGSKINHVAQTIFIFQFCARAMFPTRESEKLKHRERPSGLGIRFVNVLSCYAFSSFSGTVVTKYMILLVFVTAPTTLSKTARIEPSKSNGRQNWIQHRPSGAQHLHF